MPFLFVHYDQGAGGEFFCAKLSQSRQCVTLDYKKYPNGRTKVFDVFNQEFLKEAAQITHIESDSKLYNVVPCHVFFEEVNELVAKSQTIRIASPDINDTNLWNFLKYQQLHKVLLSRLPADLFVGECKMLLRTAKNINFLKEINGKMDGLDLILVANDILPTQENRENYINELQITPLEEPDFNFDLIISYHDLIFSPAKVKESIRQVFGIEIDSPWLETFHQNYEAFLSQT